MKRLLILAEGQSEEFFANKTITDHLYPKYFGVVHVCKLDNGAKGNGGVTSYKKLKDGLLRHIRQNPNAIITTMMDLYGLKDEFPGYAASARMGLKGSERAEYIETAIGDDLSVSAGKNYNFKNFLLHIQPYEYEALLFADPTIATSFIFEETGSTKEKYLKQILDEFGDPELINDSKETAPSKRIQQLAKLNGGSYNKVLDGFAILKAIGLKDIRAKCAHFDNWLRKLEGKAN